MKIIWIIFKDLVPTACWSTFTSVIWSNFYETHTIYCVGRVQFLTLQQTRGCYEILYFTHLFFSNSLVLLTFQMCLEFFIDITSGNEVGKFKYKENSKL